MVLRVAFVLLLIMWCAMEFLRKHAEKNRYSVVREFGGHGIGREMWEEPHAHHVGKPGTGLKLEAGMTFTIEPMIKIGKKEITKIGHGWTVVTAKNLITKTRFQMSIGAFFFLSCNRVWFANMR
jgi:methionine aminopeptidase